MCSRKKYKTEQGGNTKIATKKYKHYKTEQGGNEKSEE